MKRRSFLQMLALGAAALVAPIKYVTAKVKPTATGSSMVVEDIWHEVSQYLPKELVYRISNSKCYSTVYEYNRELTQKEAIAKGIVTEWGKSDSHYVRDFRLVRFVGCTSTNTKKGVKKLANIILETDKKFGFMKALSPPLMMPLAKIEDGKIVRDGRKIFVFYAAFERDPMKNEKHGKGLGYKWEFGEGGLPDSID